MKSPAGEGRIVQAVEPLGECPSTPPSSDTSSKGLSLNAAKPESRGQQPASILIVDDVVANLQVLTGMLKERGYKVRPVPSGELALRAARKEPPDLILLDINMP